MVPWSLFDNEGNMLHCVDRSAFMNCIEDTVGTDSQLQLSMDRDCSAVIDGMRFVN